MSVEAPIIRDVLNGLLNSRIEGSQALSAFDNTKLAQDEFNYYLLTGVNPVTNFSWEPGDVRRYGAVGDGITNDWLAFQTAVNVSHNVFIPFPTVSFLVSAQIDLKINWPIRIQAPVFGNTPGGVPSGPIIDFDSPTNNAAVFSCAGFLQGFYLEGVHFRFKRVGLNHRALSFRELLQFTIFSNRFEGTSTSSDDQYGIELLDATVTGGTYTGAGMIIGNYFTNVKFGIVLRPNCTTVRMFCNELYGMGPTPIANSSGLSMDNGVIGATAIGNTFQNWAKGVIDNGNSNDTSHNYFETNSVDDIDAINSVNAYLIANKRITGGAITATFNNSAGTIFIGTANFHVDNAYAEFGLGFREHLRTFNLGDFQANAPTFTGNGAQTLTAVTTTTSKYTIDGHRLTYVFMFDGTAGGTPNTELRFSLPPGLTSVGRLRTTIQVFNGGVYAVGVAECQNGDAFVRCYKDIQTAGNWTAGAVAMYGEICIEI